MVNPVTLVAFFGIALTIFFGTGTDKKIGGVLSSVKDKFDNFKFLPNSFGDTGNISSNNNKIEFSDEPSVPFQPEVIGSNQNKSISPKLFSNTLNPNVPIDTDSVMPPVEVSKIIQNVSPAPQPITSSANIQGNVQSDLKTIQKFKVFSADSSKTPRGIIRQTRRDPRKLKVDSRNRPTETASQRANRVFTSTGKFADEGRGFRRGRDRSRFNFGTNTGRGLRITTTNKGGETVSVRSNKNSRLSRIEKLRLANERIRKTFNSASISNF